MVGRNDCNIGGSNPPVSTHRAAGGHSGLFGTTPLQGASGSFAPPITSVPKQPPQPENSSFSVLWVRRPGRAATLSPADHTKTPVTSVPPHENNNGRKSNLAGYPVHRGPDLRRPLAEDAAVTIFVFGSNLAGRHGAGAALTARNNYGAVYGVGSGRTGNAYAIPTKNAQLRTLPLMTIAQHIVVFLGYARQHPDLDFLVTRIGCGLAGYTDAQIAPFFQTAPQNCRLPDGWMTDKNQ